MRWIFAFFVGLVALSVPVTANAEVIVEFFTRPGCPRCVDARRFLDNETQTRPDISVVVHDVTRDPRALERLRDLVGGAGIKAHGVPAFAVEDQIVVGFDAATTPPRLRALISGARATGEDGDICSVESLSCEDSPDELEAGMSVGRPEDPGRSIELSVFGTVDVGTLGLPLFTVVVGLVDGFNPCAMWVLLFLLAMLVNLKNRARMALIAGTFVVVSGLVYFAFMAAWLTFFTVIGMSRPVRLALAALALFVGGVNIKDFFAAGRGLSLSIPESAKPGFYARVRAILRAENLGGAMAGIVVLAFLVNLIELLCTAGLPALYTAILTSHGLPTWQYYAYLLLYISAYMLDDAILVTIGVVTLGKRKLQERGGRWLKLLSGLVVLGLGIALILRPTWLGF